MRINGPDLTPREIAILQQVAYGKKKEEIALKVYCAPATVQRDIENATYKLHAANRVEAVAIAIRLEIIK